MTETGDRERHLVKLPALDSACWHVVVEVREHDDGLDLFQTACGKVEHEGDALDRSPPGETPRDLSGTSICYDCSREVHE